MAWTNSKIFMATLEDVLENTTAIDLNTDTFKAALYNNTTAPDQTVVSANTAYAVGEWAVANEVDDPTDWATGGEPLTGVTSGYSSNVYTFDAANTPQSGTTCTLADVHGCLVYDDSATTPVADQGLSFHYFGGAQSVTGGTFTVTWHANGIVQITA
jgi:hypothetical protein